jgi:hypothetical protein
MFLKHRALISLFSLLIIFSNSSFGQGYGRKHPHDFRDFNLGFLMAMTGNSYNLKQAVNIYDRIDGQSVFLRNITLKNRPGLKLGLITNYNYNDQISLRFIPAVSLEQRDFGFFFEDEGAFSETLRSVNTSYLDLPLFLQVKTKYYKRYRIYLLTGPQFSINFSNTKKVQNDPNLLKIQSQDIAWTIGWGMQLYGDRLKLSPEIRYSMGLTNIFVPEFTSHAQAISQLFTQQLVFCVNFE